ncbi:nuclear transport factor 2 family protein [Streptomyces sp. QHH-9511]|uniref:nuclear transport factor 2 family protein n=1 Tax=Streptomyces sp. QHH-9511 TaxID=2684468 RepID=UPI001316A2FF|nr:nuclear transport factor 2 family protein [Streptomyces sp. QHH-9511]QGZ49416.1 nuclear transport factor 2 family protein [Streptomyces sp. QHH-9511]
MHPGQAIGDDVRSQDEVRTRDDVRTLLDRYLIGLDDEQPTDAWAARLFTRDAEVAFPMSAHRGLEGLAAYHRDALAAFAATQHLGSPAVVDLLGEGRARLRANLVSTHVHHPGAAAGPLFTAGTLATGEAELTDDGWRLSSLSFRVLWTDGAPPSAKESR